MNKTSPLKITILDKEYLITCEEEEVDSNDLSGLSNLPGLKPMPNKFSFACKRN